MTISTVRRPKASVGRPDRDRTDDRADQRTGHGKTEPEGARQAEPGFPQAKDVLQGLGCPRNHRRVEAEKQPAQRGHHGAAEEITVDFHDLCVPGNGSRFCLYGTTAAGTTEPARDPRC